MSSKDIADSAQQAEAIENAETQLSTGSVAATFVGEPIISADGAGANQFTQFTSGNNTSSGFAQAQAMAQLAQKGMLLKKRFLLEDVLGRGGMGTVYRAKDLRKVEAEDPNPYIATKVLNEGFRQHPDAFVTLQQEAAKSHTLAHPNIVTVHDFDRDGDTLFMTMELLQGDPLDALLKANRNSGFAKDKAFSIVRDLCSALAYAHQRHIIHADFKPGNVFVCDDGTTKVLDFGIARAASKETQKHKFDAAQLGALTPAYATIEMVRDEPLTYTDDVYALACVAYEILTGRHPYQNKSALEAKQLGVKAKPVAGLSHREWKALSQALALEKSQRIKTILEFSNAFFPSKSPIALVSAVILAVVALSGAAWFGYSQHQAKIKIQNTIADNIAQAQTCFAQSDFGCALEHSLVAVNLDASNKVASQLLAAAQLAQQKQSEAQKLLTLLNEGEACLASQDDGCAQVKAREALLLDSTSIRAQQLSAAANNLEQNQAIAETVAQAESCLQNKDIECAKMFSKKAEELNANHPSVHALLAKLQLVQQQSKQLAEAQQQKIATQLQMAQDCYLQKKYDCAIVQASAVLALDSANAQAMEIKQSSSIIQSQSRDAENRVTKILVQAKECLDKQKNYSCAIAKAEAALDLMPNNAEAMAIKNRAQETQRKIKETGFNIK